MAFINSIIIERMLPEIEKIIKIYKKDPEKGFNFYIDFIKINQLSLEKIILEGLRDPIDVGHISSRLLRDPIESGRNIKETAAI